MAEPKRVSLQTCIPGEQPSSSKAAPTATVTSSNQHSNNNNNNAAAASTSTGGSSKKKSEKKKKKDKQIAPSIRFSLNLFESNDHKYPEFNYADLLKNAERKRKRDKKKNEGGSSTNGSAAAPFDETDEDEKVLDVARYFEEKYGNRKKSDYVDLGAGYDDNDSFIDNTDMYDELVPQEVTTVHGGFYVNSGPLEFKDSDNVNELIKRHNLLHNDNDDDEEDESSDEDSEDEEEVVVASTSAAKKNSTKRISSDAEELDISQPPKSKPRIVEAEIVL